MALNVSSRDSRVVPALLALLRRLLLGRGTTRSALVHSTAALSVLTLLARFFISRASPSSGLVAADLGRVGRRVRRRGDDYKLDEYDVVIIGGGKHLTIGCHHVGLTNVESQGLRAASSPPAYQRILLHVSCSWKQARGMSGPCTVRILSILTVSFSSMHTQFSRVPALYAKFLQTKYDYKLYTVPQNNAENKVKYWPRGDWRCLYTTIPSD